MTPPQSTPDDFRAVRDWANPLLTHAHAVGDIPTAGSTEWQQLDNHDPRKPAAVVRAALAWLRESSRDAITARIQSELDTLDRLAADRATALASDLSTAADWRHIAAGPTQRELHRRRHHRPPCPHCHTPLGWTDTHCPDCGWTEPTPAQIQAAARQSWTHDNPLETAA